MAAFACAKDAAPSFLEADDLVPTDVPFDRNTIVENTVALTDPYSLPEGVAAFLKKTPYKRPSFLSAYQSNGVVAADAITRAAEVHQINPLVLLVRAQTKRLRGGSAGKPVRGPADHGERAACTSPETDRLRRRCRAGGEVAAGDHRSGH